MLFDIGNGQWFENIERTTEAAAKSESVELTCVIPDKEVRRHVARTVPSSLHGNIEKPEDDTTHGRGPVWGTAIHACFEHGVEWLDEANEVSDEALQKIVTEAISGETFSFTPKEVVAQFRKSCKMPEIVKALSRSRYSSSLNAKVERERKFIVWVEHKIMHGSVDRLVVQRDASGSVMEVEVFDYKSDVADDVNRLVDVYRPQLEAYRKGMAALFNIGIERVKATFVFVSLGKIETLF